MSHNASMVQYYAARAREYERIYQKPERQEDLRALHKFLEEAFLGADVFEVACGTGYWTQSIAGSVKSVLATDINEEVLHLARAKGLDPQKVTFHREDAYAPQHTHRKFNAGFSAFWWSHIPKPRIRSFLQSFHERLAPSAKVIFIDNVYVPGSSTPISRTDSEGNTYQRRRLDDGSTHEVLKNFPGESDLRQAVDQLADQVRIQFLAYYWILSYITPSHT